MDIYEKYKQQYAEFVKIDHMNMGDKAKRVPAEKHFWACQIIERKKERFRLLRKKKELKDNFIREELEKGPVAVSKKTLEGLEIRDDIIKINDQLQNLDLLIEFLEMIHKHVTFIGNDIRNMILIDQMEQE